MIDFGYGIRYAVLVLRHRAIKKKQSLWAESVVTGRCWPNDLDTNLRMNHARCLREADFGRIFLLLETGLSTAMTRRRESNDPPTNYVVGALQVQYQQSVQLGDRFSFTSRLVGWDERAFYMEQRMSLDKNQQMVCSLLTRIVITPRSVSPEMLVKDLGYGLIESPALPPAVEIFKQNHRLTFTPSKSDL